MRDTKPFYAVGKTILVAADIVAPTGTATVCPNNTPDQTCQYRVQNNGSVTVFYAFGVDAATAAANAVIPTGTSRDSYPLGAGAIEVISAPRNSFFSAITAAGTASVFVTPGEGV